MDEPRKRTPREAPSRDQPPLPAILHGPLRAGALMCLSGGIYALTLAGVAAAQQTMDDAVMAARQPDLEALARLSATADRLAHDVQSLVDLQSSSTERYGTTAQGVIDLETRLASLADEVSAVSGAVEQLPQRLDLPAVPRIATVAPAPRTHATTRASGG